MALLDYRTGTGCATAGVGALYSGGRYRPDKAIREAVDFTYAAVALAETACFAWFHRPVREMPGYGPRLAQPTQSAFVVMPSLLDGTSAEYPDSEMALLEAAAEAGDERAFSRAALDMDWRERPAADFARAIRLALAAGAHGMAHRLVRVAYEMYPTDPSLERIFHVLLPRKATRPGGPADPTLRDNMRWFSQHSAEYRGQWVAVRAGKLLGHAPTLALLTEQVPDWRHATVTRVAW